jgi:hypothetical protein
MALITSVLPYETPRTFHAQLRVLFAVAVNSGMLDDKTELTPAHLGLTNASSNTSWFPLIMCRVDLRPARLIR